MAPRGAMQALEIRMANRRSRSRRRSDAAHLVLERLSVVQARRRHVAWTDC